MWTLRFLTLLGILFGGCTRHNPAFCCLNEEDCAALGADELRPCESGQVCSEHTCRLIECETASDCSAQAGPYCSYGVCSEVCRVDSDCIGLDAAPRCASDGVCVGCTSNADCSGSTPVCDPARRSCEPCRDDAECPSGVCLAADGRCASPEELIYVHADGQDDGNPCTKTAPCKTIDAALLRVGPMRGVIRLLGSQFVLPTQLTLKDVEVYIDAQRTEVLRSGGGTRIRVEGTSPVTLEGLRLSTDLGTDSEIVIATANQHVRLSQIDAAVTRSNLVYVMTGSAEIVNSKITGPTLYGVLCTGSELEIRGSTLNRVTIDGSGCIVTLRENHFTNTRTVIFSPLSATNNLIVSTDADCELGMGGSTVRIVHNTFICQRATPVTGNPLSAAVPYCTPDSDVTNNIFAWNSATPIDERCLAVARNNAFLPETTSPLPSGSIRAAASELFADPLRGDFRLRPGSPAIGAGLPIPGLSVDLEGNRRSDTAPDLGAFESP